MNDEKKNKSIKGDFRITEFIEFIVRMASGWLTLFKDCITKKENAKYTPPINPKLIIAISSIHKSKDIILKSILKITHPPTNKKPHLESIKLQSGYEPHAASSILNYLEDEWASNYCK